MAPQTSGPVRGTVTRLGRTLLRRVYGRLTVSLVPRGTKRRACDLRVYLLGGISGRFRLPKLGLSGLQLLASQQRERRLTGVIGTGGRRTARKAALCAACGRPTFMRDPHGRPLHRLDGAGDPDAA